MFARIVSIRRMLGLGFAATLMIAAGDGQPASAHTALLPQPLTSHAIAGPSLGDGAVAADYVVLPAPGESETVLESGEVVTALPSTGVGPSDPDKRVTHWLFVIGGALLGFGQLELARRKLLELKTVNVEQER